MTRDVADSIAWVKAHPTRQNVPGAKYRIGYGWSWSQLCVALIYWALGATVTAATANAARAKSTIVSTSRNVPDGAIVWFNMGTDGHLGFWSGGVFYSATRFASNLGSALGTMTLEQYEKASGGEYVGYSWDFIGQRFASLSIEGGNEILITESNEGNEMALRLLCAPAAPAPQWVQAVAPGDGYILLNISNGKFTGVPTATTTQFALLQNILANLNPDAGLTLAAADFTWLQALLAQVADSATASTATTVKLAASDEALLTAIAAKVYPTSGTLTLK